MEKMVFLKALDKKTALECLQYAESVIREASSDECVQFELKIGVTPRLSVVADTTVKK